MKTLDVPALWPKVFAFCSVCMQTTSVSAGNQNLQTMLACTQPLYPMAATKTSLWSFGTTQMLRARMQQCSPAAGCVRVPPVVVVGRGGTYPLHDAAALCHAGACRKGAHAGRHGVVQALHKGLAYLRALTPCQS